MLQPSDSQGGVSLNLIEAGLTLIAMTAAFAWPRFASSSFARIERAFGRLARKKGTSVAVVGAAAVLIRLAILPACPIPLPFLPDDFSFLLASDTFLHGRLANPTPAMWVHFETIHVDMKPTYMSMYFPGQALVLAAGKLLFGHPWFGVLLTDSLMCAAICWMLQAWLPPAWALAGGLIAVVRLGLFTYWINTYTGAGPIAALGGALVLGALPRLMKTARFRYGLLMGAGIVLLVMTRPYEGLLLCLPVAVVLGRWVLIGKNRPSMGVLLRRAAAPLALTVAAGTWLGYYDYRAFGSPLTLPYNVDRATYAMAPYYIWQSPRPMPNYRHEALKRFYSKVEMRSIDKIQSLSGYVPQSLLKAVNGVLFFAGLALLVPLVMIRRALIDRRIRFLIFGLLILTAGMAIEIYMIPHYLAPFTAAFYAIGLQCMRHLRVWTPGDQPVGIAMVRLIFTVCFILAGVRVCAGPLGIKLVEWPASVWTNWWYGPGHFGTERARIEARMDQMPGKQLAIVQYSPDRDSLDEWVYNRADIDGSKVIWARQMDAADDEELLEYYKDRKAWLVQMGTEPATVSPYPLPAQVPLSSH